MFNLTKNYILLVIRCIPTSYHSFKQITNIRIKCFIVQFYIMDDNCNDAYFEIYSIIHAL